MFLSEHLNVAIMAPSGFIAHSGVYNPSEHFLNSTHIVHVHYVAVSLAYNMTIAQDAHITKHMICYIVCSI